MSTISWILESVIHAVHDEQIAEHGGLEGVRDVKLLQSAIMRPQNLAAYEKPDLADLAACYAVGIAKNHPYNDGNKRTAFVVMELFLYLNQLELTADDASCVMTMLDVAAGNITEDKLAAWLRNHTEPLAR